VLCIALFVALSWTPIFGSGRPQQKFRASTELVRVYATVRDKSGHLVTDLRAEDFEIRDRGTLLTRGVIGWFSHERIVIGSALTANTEDLKTQIDTEIQTSTISPVELGAGKSLADRFAIRHRYRAELWASQGLARQAPAISVSRSGTPRPLNPGGVTAEKQIEPRQDGCLPVQICHDGR
jgi:hypothetical protein